MRPGTVIALVFAGSAAVAGLLFVLDARQRARTAPSATATFGLPPPVEDSAELPEVVELRSTTSRSAPPPPRSSSPPERFDGPCAPDMVLVSGEYCPFVAHRCDKKRAAPKPGEEPTCERYKNEVLCEGGLVGMRYCIDLLEYPNRRGVLPAVLVSFEEAERVCSLENKRLCTAREWSFACEGEAVLPYPIGLERTAATCNWDAGTEARIAPTRGPSVAGAMNAVDKRVPGGDRPACASPFGVLDLAGNVAEWVVEPVNSRTADPFASVVAGGAWGKGPGACRSLDDAHPPPHRSSSVGFRCCADAFSEAGGARGPVHGKPTGRKGSGMRPVVPSPGLP